MSKVVIYSKVYCPYCVRAKNFFKERNIEFTEHIMDDRLDELDALKQKTGHMTVPQIFVNDTFIGGFTDLVEAESNGELAKLLNQK